MLRTRTALSIATVAVTPAVASACGACGYAISESILPPILIWMLAGAVWFCLTVFLEWNPQDARSTLILALFKAIGIAVAVTLLGGVTILLVSLVLPAVAARRTFLHGWRMRASTHFQKILARALGAFFGLILFGSLVYMTPVGFARDDVGFVLRYPGTGPVANRMDSMERRRDLTSLRRILAATDVELESSRAALALGRIGSPSIDAPLILRALSRREEAPRPLGSQNGTRRHSSAS